MKTHYHVIRVVTRHELADIVEREVYDLAALEREQLLPPPQEIYGGEKPDAVAVDQGS